jgi:transposase, IS6 family
MLSSSRDVKAAKRFFRKALSSPHSQTPRVITVDKNPAYPPALQQLKDETEIPQETSIRQMKYLNDIVEQDHRFIKKITNPMMGFKSFQTADYTLKGIEAIHMLRKGQVELQNPPVSSVVKFISNLFHLTA